MMKKILLFSTALIAFSFGGYSQNSVSGKNVTTTTKQNPTSTVHSGSKVAYTVTAVRDTLHYFFNKQLYKIPNVSITGFPYYPSPAATGTALTHVGSVFLNSDTLVVHGLEVRAAKNDGATFHQTVGGRLYLCNLNAQNLPILPAIDSVNFSIGSAHPYTGAPHGHMVGGDFGTLANPVSHTLTGNYAILARNTATTQGDTIRIFRTAAITSTALGDPFNRFGEGLGVVRQGTVMNKTTNFGTKAMGFGNGTDYEFCVAPRVTYTLISDHVAPQEVTDQNTTPVWDSIACWQALNFTNKSSSQFTNRFFNLNQFYLKWAPFVSTPPGGFSPDSAVTWTFDDQDNYNPLYRKFLHYGTNSITKLYDSAGCFTNCLFKTRLRKMAALSGASMVLSHDSTFKVCVQNCNANGDVLVKSNLPLSTLRIYPNPTANSKTAISGLNGKNTISIYNLLGQLVSSEITEQDIFEVDLQNRPKGTYMIRIVNSNGDSRNVKIINQKE